MFLPRRTTAIGLALALLVAMAIAVVLATTGGPDRDSGRSTGDECAGAGIFVPGSVSLGMLCG